MAKQYSQNQWKVIKSAIVLVVCIFIYFASCTGSEETTSKSETFKPETSEAFDRSLLFVKHHVEGRLKYPAESDFDAYSVSKEELYPNVFRVKGDLNTKNGFGVTVTMKYDYIVEFLGGDVESSNNWRIEKSDLK